MGHKTSTDYETYREIMGELLQPITATGLDDDTLKRLYESKLVYLENLREKCFVEINIEGATFFTVDDFVLILEAIQRTKLHLKSIIIMAITNNLAKRKVS